MTDFRNAGGVIMSVAYGYTLKGLEDDFVSLAKETSQITGKAMAPGWLVDSFPFHKRSVIHCSTRSRC